MTDKDNKPINQEVNYEEEYLREKKKCEEVERALKNLEEEAKNTVVKLRQLESDFNKLSHFDSLTELPNRIQFDADLKREMARAKRYKRRMGLLYLNLDFFKKVNDSFGHEFGDLLLKEASKRLAKLLRTEDSAARLGGDEFAVILTEIDTPHDAGIVAHRMVEKMSAPYFISGRIVVVGVSIGVAVYPDAGDSASLLHKHAGMALHSAKAGGRSNYQFFTKNLQEQQHNQLELEAEMHFALERNEFFLVYQPRIDLQTGDMVGMEALLRWQHPKRGVVSPADFIPIAEETGLIVPIGTWVIQTACRQFAVWREKNNLECSLAVNVSPRQFQHRNFADLVVKVLEDTKIPPHLLELEITETAISSFLGKIEDVLFKLRHMGVQFSIDDFGTGYSSLSRLKELPIQSIKIDRSFVTDIDVKISDNLIIKSTIELAKDMGLNVVAEGVETESQLKFLIKNQCPQAQGYYYSKPLPPEQMEVFIHSIKKKSTI